MKFKLAFASATALALLMGTGVVLAGSLNQNDTSQNGNNNTVSVLQYNGTRGQSYLNQNGDSNSAHVTQSSNSDSQYYTPSGNLFGTAGNHALQNGNNNSLTLTQDYYGNNGNQVGTAGAGFEQHGDANQATITQNGPRNLVLEVVQTDGNSLTVTQGRAAAESDYAYNRVNSVQQTNTGGVANTATIIQQGATGSGHLNKLDKLIQNGSGDQATVTQTGNRNALGSVSQTNGASNSVVLNVAGDYNGSDGADALNEQVIGAFGASQSRGFAAGSGAVQGSVLQSGTANQVNYAITGNNNLFGFAQNGTANTIDGHVTGDSNQLALLQSVAAGTGHAEATVNVDQNSNDIAVQQTVTNGSRLALATINVNGTGNNLNVNQGQIGNGRDSLVDVTITGDLNNSVAAFSTGGDASDALNFSHRQLGSGQIFQAGSGNQLTYDVTGDSNQFAFYQSGTGNTVAASTTNSYNQAAVSQTGSNNTANFTQIGNSNNFGATQ